MKDSTKRRIAVAGAIAVTITSAIVSSRLREKEAEPKTKPCVELAWDAASRTHKHHITAEGLEFLAQKGIDANTARKYNTRFAQEDYYDRCEVSLKGITDLHATQIPPEIANAYDTRFEVKHIVEMGTKAKNDPRYLPESMNKYHPGFSAEGAIALADKGRTPEDVNRYRDVDMYAVQFIDIPFEEFKALTSQFNGEETRILFDAGVSAKKASRYDHDAFTGRDIADLVQGNVNAARARQYVAISKKYGVRLDGAEIAALEERRVPLSVTEERARLEFIDRAVRDDRQ